VGYLRGDGRENPKMKKYPDNTEFFALKEARRQEIDKLSDAERLKIAKRLSTFARQATGRRVVKKRSPNWSLATGRPPKKKQ
jgi:hypothetical protein